MVNIVIGAQTEDDKSHASLQQNDSWKDWKNMWSLYPQETRLRLRNRDGENMCMLPAHITIVTGFVLILVIL